MSMLLVHLHIIVFSIGCEARLTHSLPTQSRGSRDRLPTFHDLAYIPLEMPCTLNHHYIHCMICIKLVSTVVHNLIPTIPRLIFQFKMSLTFPYSARTILNMIKKLSFSLCTSDIGGLIGSPALLLR